ncbi:hypothetical protein [Bacillus cereus]|uniref:hypothetical protein n=1 Tax=Bacillus cereus TaxID=1396 RepID=UPI000B4C12DF|nr:hypothetical protein [Bacillus cereus]
MSNYINENSDLLRTEILSSLEQLKNDVAPGFFEYLENLPKQAFDLEMSALEEVDKDAVILIKNYLKNTSGKNISNC